MKIDTRINNSGAIMNLYLLSDATDAFRTLDQGAICFEEHQQNVKQLERLKKSGRIIELTYDVIKIYFRENLDIAIREDNYICGNGWKEIIDSL